MADRRADRTKPALFAALLALLLLDAAWLGWGERLELAAGDRLLARHAATRAPDPDVVVVTIDERSLEALAPEFGRFPWPRSAYAELAEGLVAQDAAAVVLDITFTEADVNNPDADAWFVETFTKDPRLFLPMVRLDPAADGAADALALDAHGEALGFARTDAAVAGARVALQLPFEQVAFAGRTGAINFLPDDDGIGRRYHVDLEAHGWLIPSLPARVVRALGGATPEARTVDIHWRGASGARPRRSFSDVLAALRAGEDAGVAGRIVVVGSDAQGMGDVRATPLDPLQPGVEVLAAAIETLRNGDALRRPPAPTASALALLMLGLVLALSLRGASPLRLGAALALATPLAAGAAYAAFDSDLRLPWLQPVLWGWLGVAGSAGADWVRERRARLETQQIFSRFVDARVVAQLVGAPGAALDRAGEQREISVLFSDIRGFTHFSETRPPAEVVAMLNRYFSRQVEVVFRHGGTIDKFIGDAIMAFWGAPVADPDHAKNAVAAALEMARVADEFAAELAAQGAPFGIGVGIHSGSAVVGFIGSENRLDYTAIGDTVNLASRIEGATKGVATVLVSDATRRLCGDAFSFEARGTFKVKGRDAEVDLFEPRARA
jgi:adenylate cyclase